MLAPSGDAFAICFNKFNACRYLAFVAYQSTMMLAQSPHPTATESWMSCRKLAVPFDVTDDRGDDCCPIQGGIPVAVGWVAMWRWPMRWLESKLIFDLNSTPYLSIS